MKKNAGKDVKELHVPSQWCAHDTTDNGMFDWSQTPHEKQNKHKRTMHLCEMLVFY